MRKYILVLLAVACFGVTGCVSPQPRVVKLNDWVVVENSDRFSDEKSTMVTISERPSSSLLVTSAFRLYPFVEKRGENITVGIRTGGTYKIPTGTVQIRVDNNSAWTIDTSETPLYLVPAQQTYAPPPKPESTDPKQQEQIRQAHEHSQQMTQNIHKISSPFTAATGDKAKTIIKEMLSGSEMIYRTVGVNQAASTEGSVVFNDSFREAMDKAGITLDTLK